MGTHVICMTPFVDSNDVTLADEDTNSIQTYNANKVIQGNVAMQVMQPVSKIYKWCHVMANFGTNASGAT